MRDISGYSFSGHISNVENGHAMPSLELVEAYVHIGGERTRIAGAYESAKRATTERRKDRRTPKDPVQPDPLTVESPLM
jgi:hypothetical protein